MNEQKTEFDFELRTVCWKCAKTISFDFNQEQLDKYLIGATLKMACPNDGTLLIKAIEK